EPAAERGAVDRGDRRNGASGEPAEIAAVAQQLGPHLVQAHVAPLFQVGAGAKCAVAAAGDHHGAVLARDVVAKHVAKRLERREIERIAALLPYDGEDQGAALATDL